MPLNLATLDHLMALEHHRLPQPSSRGKGNKSARRVLRRNLKARRHKAVVTLVEELSIRTQKVQPLMKRAGADLGPGRWSCSSNWKTATSAGLGIKEDHLANLEKELKDLMLMTLETTRVAPAPGRGHEQPVQGVRAGQAGASCRAATSRLVVSIAGKKYRNRGLSVPRP